MIDVVVRIIEDLFNTNALRWEILIAAWVLFALSVARLCGLNTRRIEAERRALARELDRHHIEGPVALRPDYMVEPTEDGGFKVTRRERAQ